MIRRLIADERGATSVEYGLLAAALVLSLFGVASAIKGAQAAAYQRQHQGIQKWRAP